MTMRLERYPKRKMVMVDQKSTHLPSPSEQHSRDSDDESVSSCIFVAGDGPTHSIASRSTGNMTRDDLGDEAQLNSRPVVSPIISKQKRKYDDIDIDELTSPPKQHLFNATPPRSFLKYTKTSPISVKTPVKQNKANSNETASGTKPGGGRDNASPQLQVLLSRAKADACEEQNARLRERFEKQERSLNDAHLRIRELEAALDEARHESLEMSQSAEGLEATRQKESEDSKHQSASVQADQALQILEKNAEIAALKRLHEKGMARRDEQIAALETKYSQEAQCRGRLRKEYDTLVNRLEECRKDASTLREQLDCAEGCKAELDEIAARHLTEIGRLMSELAGVQKELREHKDEAGRRIEEAERRQVEADNAAGKLKESLATRQSENTDLEWRLAYVQKVLNTINHETNQLKAQAATHEKVKKQFDAANERAKRAKQDDQERIRALEIKVTDLEQHLAAEKDLLKATSATAREDKAQLVEIRQTTLPGLTSQCETLQRDKTALGEKVIALDSQICALQATAALEKTQIRDLSAERAALEEKVVTLGDQIRALEATSAEEKAQIKDLSADIAAQWEERERMVARIDAWNKWFKKNRGNDLGEYVAATIEAFFARNKKGQGQGRSSGRAGLPPGPGDGLQPDDEAAGARNLLNMAEAAASGVGSSQRLHS